MDYSERFRLVRNRACSISRPRASPRRSGHRPQQQSPCRSLFRFAISRLFVTVFAMLRAYWLSGSREVLRSWSWVGLCYASGVLAQRVPRGPSKLVLGDSPGNVLAEVSPRHDLPCGNSLPRRAYIPMKHNRHSTRFYKRSRTGSQAAYRSNLIFRVISYRPTGDRRSKAKSC